MGVIDDLFGTNVLNLLILPFGWEFESVASESCS